MNSTTDTQQITAAQKRRLEELREKAGPLVDQLNRMRDEAIEILGDDRDDMYATDLIYWTDPDGVDELLESLGIEVAPEPGGAVH